MTSIGERRLHAEHTRIANALKPGFSASPKTNSNGTVDYYSWNCIVPGTHSTAWEGGYYPVRLEFPPEYPSVGPMAYFDKRIVHPNVWPTGNACLSILARDWKVSTSIPDILMALQKLLAEPNFGVQDWERSIYSSYANKDNYNKLIVKTILPQFRK